MEGGKTLKVWTTTSSHVGADRRFITLLEYFRQFSTSYFTAWRLIAARTIRDRACRLTISLDFIPRAYNVSSPLLFYFYSANPVVLLSMLNINSSPMCIWTWLKPLGSIYFYESRLEQTATFLVQYPRLGTCCVFTFLLRAFYCKCRIQVKGLLAGTLLHPIRPNLPIMPCPFFPLYREILPWSGRVLLRL